MLRQKHAGIASLKPGLVHIPPVYLTRRAAAPKGAVALFASCRQRLPDNALVDETVCPLREALPKWSGSNLRSLTGGFQNDDAQSNCACCWCRIYLRDVFR